MRFLYTLIKPPSQKKFKRLDIMDVVPSFYHKIESIIEKILNFLASNTSLLCYVSVQKCKIVYWTIHISYVVYNNPIAFKYFLDSSRILKHMIFHIIFALR